MGRKALSGTMLILVLISMLTLAFNIQPIEASSLTVHNLDTGEDFATIQEAINDSDTLDGHTIFVEEGTYNENLLIDKSLTLIGESRSNTIIDGSYVGNVINITANNVKVTEFTIENSLHTFDHYGIYVLSSGNYIGNNVMVNNSYCAIQLRGLSRNNKIHGNIIRNSNYGIQIWSSHNNSICKNTIEASREYGVAINAPSSNNSILDNVIIYNLGVGISIHVWSVFKCLNNTIIGNTITNNGVGIRLYNVTNNFVYHNSLQPSNQIWGYSQIVWDSGYPSGGNYWSDYAGVDLFSGPNQDQPGSDGIGDTPHVIDVNNEDRYPLMEPWSPPTMIKTLIRTVKFWELSKGIENSIKSKLEGALPLLDIGKENRAMHRLMAFTNQVEALQGKKLTNEQASYLISEAQRIIDLIEG